MGGLTSNKEWKKWGEIDPLFGVASWPDRNKSGTSPWTDEEFYKIGELDWAEFKNHWDRYGVSYESCLEIGCGAGRITLQLVTHFRKVHALDVSEKMIEYSRERIPAQSVAFHLSEGTNIPVDDASVHSIFSTQVFQHLDSLAVAKEYFAEIARVMKPGGTLMIHLPIYRWPSKGFSHLYTSRRRLIDIKVGVTRILTDLGISQPVMRGIWYPTEFFYDELPRLGFGEIEISFFMIKTSPQPYPFLFARKRN
jgi:SAM-dependent methyltransferase